MNWLYVILGAIVAELGKMFYLIAKRAIFEHRRKKVIVMVTAKFPDNSSVTFASVDSSDKKAMDEVIRQLTADGILPEDAAESSRVDPYPQGRPKPLADDYNMIPFPKRPPPS